MTERKWTKFKDNLPLNSVVYITDYDVVWTGIWRDYAGVKEAESLAWSAIELPEVPKEERQLHRCYSSVLCQIVCQEIDTGYLVVGQPSEECIVKNGFSVNFCPFCGYEEKNK